MVAEVFQVRGLEPQRSARLLDTLFWLEGNAGPPEKSAGEPSDVRLAEAVGEEAFARCAAALPGLIGGE